MTTRFLDNKICTFKILLSWRFPRKIAFLDDFPQCPPGPPPPQKREFYFYCRLAVSEIMGSPILRRLADFGNSFALKASVALRNGSSLERCVLLLGEHPQYGWDFPEEIPEKFGISSGNALRACPGISLESTAGMPQTL